MVLAPSRMSFWNTASKFFGFSLTNPEIFEVQETLDEKSSHTEFL